MASGERGLAALACTAARVGASLESAAARTQGGAVSLRVRPEDYEDGEQPV